MSSIKQNDKDLQAMVVSFAGVVQAADLVDRLARKGDLSEGDTKRFQHNINSLFVFGANGVEEVLGPFEQMQFAFLYTYQMFAKPNSTPRNVLRYVVSMLKIHRIVAKNPYLMQSLRENLERIEKHRDDNEINNVTISRLAHAYQSCCGREKTKHQIYIYGSQMILTEEYIQNTIRATLLSGIRCAALWTQMGGSRLKLILHRNKFMQELKKLTEA